MKSLFVLDVAGDYLVTAKRPVVDRAQTDDLVAKFFTEIMKSIESGNACNARDKEWELILAQWAMELCRGSKVVVKDNRVGCIRCHHSDRWNSFSGGADR